MLLKEHVREGLGPRRPAPPLGDTAPVPTPSRRPRRWLPLLAAACVAAVVVAAALLVARVAGDQTQPAAQVIGRWQRVDLPNGGYAERNLSSVGFADQRHGWIVGSLSPRKHTTSRCAVWTTSDGGRLWTLHVPHVPDVVSNCVAAFGDASHGWLAVNAAGGIDVYASADGGASWSRRATLAGQADELVAVDARHAWLSGRSGVLAATTDGTSWAAVRLPDGVSGGELDFVDPLHGWLSGSNGGGTYATPDGGQTWRRLPNPNGRRLGARLDFVSARAGWAITPRWVLRTHDGGHTWQRVRHMRFYPQALAFSDVDHGWIFGNPFLGTANGGRSWTVHRLTGDVLAGAAAGCSTVAITSATVHHYARCPV
jgi:photosystem II stability/assembly factor-like uncharacterized protein